MLDVNDNSPQLQLPALSFSVPENTSEPLYITTAVATDDDIGKIIMSGVSERLSALSHYRDQC